VAELDEAATGAVRHIDEVAAQPVAAGVAATIQVLVGPEQGAPAFALRRFVMAAGGGVPRHTNTVEHEQYVLAGRARVHIGDAVHEVRAGSALFIPAGAPHHYEVVEGPFEFLCIVPSREDTIAVVPGGGPAG
jgi:quercetin dioxygenase-like cupin family protein